MKALLVGVAVASTGCDAILALRHVDLGADGSTSGLDATAGVACAAMTPAPFLCADFDESDPTYYLGVLALPIPANTDGRLTASLSQPAVSPPTALWLDDQNGGQYYVDIQTASPTVKTLTATFDVKFESYPLTASPTGPVRIELKAPNGTPTCDVVLVAEVSPNPYLDLSSHCNDGTSTPTNDQMVLPALPTQWLHVDLVLDVAAGQATVTIDGQQHPPMNLDTTNPNGGTPFIRFGIPDANGTNGPKIGLDNLVVVAK